MRSPNPLEPSLACQPTPGGGGCLPKSRFSPDLEAEDEAAPDVSSLAPVGWLGLSGVSRCGFGSNIAGGVRPAAAGLDACGGIDPAASGAG